ncbi:hypothetical protein MUK42_31823 [Musa troglodytarum]|uniref:Uncharacterized protein n=1 Tax=Musa troglodytarum TaxID=320322 RepID=A0A9E7FHE3_9LILI|nr:hypothetical protein MUK42_31823 [Musa troglodytarum]
MIRAGGASYRNQRPPPPPPSPPSRPAPLPPNPSSLSTLSPLAPPFSLDHVFPSPPSSSHHHPLPPQPFKAADRPSASRLPSRTVASPAVGYIRYQPSTGPVGDPYYSHYYSNSQLLAFDDSFRHSSAYSRDGAGPWNRPADEKVGLGMDSDAYKVPLFQEGDGHNYYDNDSYGVWHGKFSNSLTVCSAPFSAPSALLEEIHGSGTTDSTSGMDLRDTSVPNSTYDRYMAQLDSCSVNPLVFYPAATYSTPSQVYAPTNLRASSNFNSTSSCAMVHHEIPYKTNDPVIKPSKLKEPNLDQNLGSKAACDEKSGQDCNIMKSIVSPVDSGKEFPSGSNTASETPFNPAVLNPGLRLENLVTADASPSMCNSVEPDKSMKNSLEVLDQHNLAVDSPCWKGAPAFWQSPFPVEEILVQKALDESKNFDDLCQDRKHLFEGVGNSKDSAEQVGSLIFNEMKQSSISDKPQCSSVISSTIHEKPENSNKKLSDYKKGDNGTRVLIDDFPKEQMNKTSEVERRDSEVQDADAARVVVTEGIAVNKLSPEKGIDDHNKGSCSSPLENVKELVKTIHSSSIKLLSTNFTGDDQLEPHDYRLLYSVINNIALVLKDKKGCVGCSPRCLGIEAAWTCNRCLDADDVNQSNMDHTCNMQGKIHSVGCDNVNSEFDNFVKGCNANLGKVNGMTQAIENALSKIPSEREGDARTLLYKNLWIEAEAATCRLKYELQLTQMKIESENLKPVQSDMSSSLPSAHDLQVNDSPLKAKGSLSGIISPTLDGEEIGSCQLPHEASSTHELNKSEDIESSVMARFKVLKDRIISSNYRSMEEQGTLLDSDTGTCSDAKENAPGSPDVADSSGTKDRINLADLGFVEGVMQPNGTHKPKPWFSLSETRLDVQPPAATSDGEIRPGLDTSKYENTKEEVFSGPLNGSLIQSYMTYKQGSWSLTGGHTNPKFEWEHVPREESTQ